MFLKARHPLASPSFLGNKAQLSSDKNTPVSEMLMGKQKGACHARQSQIAICNTSLPHVAQFANRLGQMNSIQHKRSMYS